MIILLSIAGILSGLVNYFFIYLNLPTERKKENNIAYLNDSSTWQFPKLTYWLALCGYIIIGLAGAFLAPLLDSILTLKGSPMVEGNGWVLFGYGIVFGFSANRLLTSISASILSKIVELQKIDGEQRNLRQSLAVKKTEAVRAFASPSELNEGEFWPSNKSEVEACGAFSAKIVRGSSEFASLKTNNNVDIVFKNEEATGADRIMNKRLYDCINSLAEKVKLEWTNGTQPNYKLRVTEAWDENNEHASTSLHYEARSADINLWDINNRQVDTSKLGRLSSLAIDAGFDWVFFEDNTHVHVSSKKT